MTTHWSTDAASAVLTYIDRIFDIYMPKDALMASRGKIPNMKAEIAKLIAAKAPDAAPSPAAPKPTPPSPLEKMVVAPPIVEPVAVSAIAPVAEPVDSIQTPPEVPPSRLAAIKAIISKESIRLAALCERLDAPEVEIRALISDPANGLSLAKAGWVRLA